MPKIRKVGKTKKFSKGVVFITSQFYPKQKKSQKKVIVGIETDKKLIPLKAFKTDRGAESYAKKLVGNKRNGTYRKKLIRKTIGKPTRDDTKIVIRRGFQVLVPKKKRKR